MFGIRLYMFRTVSLSIITVHTAIGIDHTGYADCLLASSKHNQFLRFLKFIFGIGLYMFRTGSLSIIRSLALYTQQGDCLHNQFLRFFKFIFGIGLYMFRTVSLSIIRSLAL
jgi:hypothetical protein